MTPGAGDSTREREATRGAGRALGRISGALGVSVAVHVLGAVALWRGASEPERFVPPRPLEVELVWREAAGSRGPEGAGRSSVEAPAPGRPPGSAARPTGRGGEMRVRETVSRSGPETPSPLTRKDEPLQEAAPPEPRAPSTPLEAGVSSEVVATGSPSGSVGEGTGSEPVEAAGVGPGTSRGGSTAAGGAAGGPGADSELRAYREQLSRRVTRQRRYPAQAVRLGMEGTARVWVRINRDGSLATPPRLEGTSRFRVLDVEALRMVEAAAPFAPLPAEPYRESAEFVIPVSFSLRAAAG